MKGRLRKLVLFVLLGAIVNVAVAWGIAIRPQLKIGFGHPASVVNEAYRRYEPTEGHNLVTNVYVRPGEIRLMQNIKFNFRHLNTAKRISAKEYRTLVPNWSEFAHGEPFNRYPVKGDAFKELGWYVDYASGWPRYALRYRGRVYFNPRGPVYSHVKGCLRTGNPRTTFDQRYRKELPFHPLWLGFGINTIFYAAILWLASLAPFTLRRVIRRKRGLCPQCGYDLRGTAQMICPECGYEVRAEAGI